MILPSQDGRLSAVSKASRLTLEFGQFQDRSGSINRFFLRKLRSAGENASRRVRSDSCSCAHRFDDWSDEVWYRKTETETRRTGRREYLWDSLRPIMPYPTGRFFRGTLSQALRARLRSVCPSGTRTLPEVLPLSNCPSSTVQALRAWLLSC